jgi:MIP family channel proteins
VSKVISTETIDVSDPKDEALTRAGYQEEAPAPYSLEQRALAEFVGTFTLIFIGAGSIVAAVAAHGGQGGAGLVTIAVAHGLAIAVMVSAVGHISGGHLNPAVTLAAMAVRKIHPREGLIYLAAQLGGAIAGAAVLRAALPQSLWRQANLGTPGLGGGVSAGQGALIEAVLTFFLIWVVFATAVDPEGAFGKIAGLAIGFVVMMDIMMGGPFTGGAMNPARFLGPALIGGHWNNAWVYFVGPIAGGLLAAGAYGLFILPRHDAAQATS